MPKSLSPRWKTPPKFWIAKLKSKKKHEVVKHVGDVRNKERKKNTCMDSKRDP